ncbi:MAG: DUF535 domain-containing protein [Schwartzia sp.]|nr:DUF535 domain-containing protein [Schwartzia sp. (in: firmicutes)]
MRQSFITLGKKIYDVRKSREARRMLVFVARCYLNRGRLEALDDYFHQTPLLAEIADIYPFVYEQPTRAFFYNGSTFDERARLVEEHMAFLAERLRPEVLTDIYREEEQLLWQMDRGEAPPLRLVLFYEPGQRKEGILSVILRLGTSSLYQMIFWIARDHVRDSEWALWIGAMQGPNMADAREVIKRITKECHAYRTKNLILYATQAVARALGIGRIYAVTNEGYYANNHLRMDRKLKTSFSDFWMEAGGWKTEDGRFDALPLTEPRKTMEEVPVRKRAVYRKRFALLDEIDNTIAENMARLMK